tara:strand:- start:4212 stop:5417 length:1206 start_codon:yes stop_codon:yes gene_type:complete
MAQLNYKLPTGVMTAYGDALKGTVDPDLAKSKTWGSATAAGAKVVVDGETARRERKALEQAEIVKQEEANRRKLSGAQEKFATKAREVANGTVKLGTEGQDLFKESFITPLSEEHDKFVLDGSYKEALEVRGMVTTIGKNTKALSGGLQLVAKNQGEGNLDKDSIPEEDWEWMEWLMDVNKSSLTLKADVGDGSSKTGEVYYEMPSDEEGGEPIKVTAEMMSKLNTVYMKPDPMPFAKSLEAVAAKSKKSYDDDKPYEIPIGMMTEVRKSITPDSIRGMMFNKAVWSTVSADEEGKPVSWFDQWSQQEMTIDLKIGDDAPQGLKELDTDPAGGDGYLSQKERKGVTLSAADKRAMANLLITNHYDEATEILAAYAKTKLENKVYKDTRTASTGNTINNTYA